MVDWRHQAVCRDEDPELFFPVGTSGPALLQMAEAKAVCARCPVRSACLEWALASGQDDGVWGGLSADERRATLRGKAERRRGERWETTDPAPRVRMCTGCRMDRPLADFHKESKRQDGLSTRCKGCIAVRDRKRRAAEVSVD